jgi:hypothetical protein
MLLARNVSELKVKGKNGDYPAVDAGGRRYIRIVQHAANVPGVYFDNEIADADDENLVGT